MQKHHEEEVVSMEAQDGQNGTGSNGSEEIPHEESQTAEGNAYVFHKHYVDSDECKAMGIEACNMKRAAYVK